MMGSRAVALALAVTMGLAGVVAVSGSASSRAPGPDAGPVALPWKEPAWSPKAKEVPGHPGKARFPAPGSWELVLGGKGEIAAAADLPVSLSAGVDGMSGVRLRVQVFDRDLARRVGASGFVFSVADAEDGALAKDGGLPAEVMVNYADNAQAYGADYHRRLRVRALDACVLVNPVPSGCSVTGPELPMRNDVDRQQLKVDVEDLAKLASDGKDAGAVFAVTSGAGGDTGTFAATPLSIAGSWQVAPGSGEFNYTHPIAAPKPAGGSAPTVGLSYSSGAVDGMTNATNTQASEVGLGWSSFANAFIERRYEPCVQTLGSPDLCWAGDNATISLGGVSGPMVAANTSATQWQLLSDPGWKIERDGGAWTDPNKPADATHLRERWKVTGPDGTEYWFGFGHGPGTYTNSVLGIDVFADNENEPCRGVNAGPVDPGHCRLPWRWYLDRVRSVQPFLRPQRPTRADPLRRPREQVGPQRVLGQGRVRVPLPVHLLQHPGVPATPADGWGQPAVSGCATGPHLRRSVEQLQRAQPVLLLQQALHEGADAGEARWHRPAGRGRLELAQRGVDQTAQGMGMDAGHRLAGQAAP